MEMLEQGNPMSNGVGAGYGEDFTAPEYYAFNSQETFGGVISLHSILGPKMDSAKESISMRECFVLI